MANAHDSIGVTTSLLLHPKAEQALAAIGKIAAELAKLNASMDVLIAAKGDKVRPAVAALAERLIAFLDATGPDPDLEEDEGDDNPDAEPSLGALELVDQARAWAHCGDREDGEIDLGSPVSQTSQLFSNQTFGSQDEREEEDEGFVGFEASLSSLGPR
jgi:hypothetical protein